MGDGEGGGQGFFTRLSSGAVARVRGFGFLKKKSVKGRGKSIGWKGVAVGGGGTAGLKKKNWV